MKQIDLDSWDEVEAELKRIQAERDAADQGSPMRGARYLFRGHSDESWRLETTLERRGLEGSSFSDYFRLVSVAQPAIETFTGQSWDLADWPSLRDWSTEYDNLQLTQFPGYDYLSYLRHHGFPSPLLDWSASPYVAAYFAFASATEQSRAAIFVYSEYATGHGKVGTSDKPQIVRFGPYVGSHARHFLQQSQYTICARFNKKWYYAQHEDVFAETPDTQGQLVKITAPGSERGKVLSQLDAHNLNAFSLFRTDEALLEMIAMREIDLKPPQ